MTRKLFEAKPFTPGAELEWTHEDEDGRREQRTGQCWAYAPNVHGSPTIWVVPDDGGAIVVACRVRQGGKVYTQAGKAFYAGQIFSEASDLSPTGSITQAAWKSTLRIRAEKIARAAGRRIPV